MPSSPASTSASPSASAPASAPAPQPPDPRPQWSLLITGLLAGVLLSGGALLLWERPSPPPIAIQLPPTVAPALDALLPTPSPTPAPVVVHVTGAVQWPGVYTLPAGARVVDALDAAGGLSLDANDAAVNQAELLWDEAQVYVPSLGDAVPPPPAGISGERSVPLKAIPGADSGLINVNTATAEELDTLPGIGPDKAAAIIANRPYASVEDLDRVPGIGPATLDDLRDRVTVQ